MVYVPYTIQRKLQVRRTEANLNPEILLIRRALQHMFRFWFATKAEKAIGCLVSDVSVQKEKIVHRVPVIWSALPRTNLFRARLEIIRTV